MKVGSPAPRKNSGGLLRALFRAEAPANDYLASHRLTRCESDVLQLIGQGLSNKEIARKLCVSVATVKHHVLDKLHLPRRAQAMPFVRDSPWIATPAKTSAARNANEQ